MKIHTHTKIVMKKNEWIIVLLPLFVCWVLDRFSKLWANLLENKILSYGYLNFVLHHNHGAMLGLFSELPQVLRIVSLSTGGAFLLCIYVLIQYLLPIKSLVLRTGLSILIGGILGNVADRIIWGYVVDFIVIGTPSISSPAFNIADAVQWVGYAMIVYAIIKEGEILWPEHNSRRKYWVNPSFQLKYCFVLLGVGIGLTLISLVFSYTYLRVSISELVGGNQFLISKFISPFVITYLVISIGFCAILFAVGKTISHRIAGPLYAFERFLDDALAGRNSHLKLRAGDEFKHLEEIAELIKARLDSMQESTMEKVAKFEDNKIEN